MGTPLRLRPFVPNTWGRSNRLQEPPCNIYLLERSAEPLRCGWESFPETARYHEPVSWDLSQHIHERFPGFYPCCSCLRWCSPNSDKSVPERFLCTPQDTPLRCMRE